MFDHGVHDTSLFKKNLDGDLWIYFHGDDFWINLPSTNMKTSALRRIEKYGITYD